MRFNQERFGQCTASLNALAAYIKAEYAGIVIMYGDTQHLMHPILVHREQEEYHHDDHATTTNLEGAGTGTSLSRSTLTTTSRTS